jgi:hypothetical protein
LSTDPTAVNPQVLPAEQPAAAVAAPAPAAAAAAPPAAKPAGIDRKPTDLKQFGPVVKLNADGTLTCRACGLPIEFLPPEFPAEDLPAGAPRTVNHTGCGKAHPTDDSPAGQETINVIEQAEVAEFYADKATFGEKRGLAPELVAALRKAS